MKIFKIPYSVLSVLFILFILMIVFLEGNYFVRFDNEVLQFIENNRTKEGIWFFENLTKLGNTFFVIVELVFFISVFWAIKMYRQIVIYVSMVGMSVLSGLGLKLLFDRARPESMLNIEGAHFPSFPSNHTVVMTVMCGLLIYIFRKYFAGSGFSIFVQVLLTLIMIGVGFSRMYLGVHYLSDVVGGYLWGGMFVWLGVFLMRGGLEIDSRNRV